MADARQTVLLALFAASLLAATLTARTLGCPDPAVMLALVVGSFVAGIAGLAFSAICSAALLQLMPDPLHMIQLLALCSFANQILTVWDLRRDIAWRGLPSYVLGGVAGVAPGLWSLVHIRPGLLAPGIGTVLLGYAAHLLLGRAPAWQVDSRWADAGVGFTAAATGMVSTLPSLPVTMWCQARGMDKDRLRATVQPFVLALQFVTLPLMALAAPDSAIAASDLLYLPASLFGTQIGLGCVRGLTNRQFAVAVAALLILCGTRLWL